MGEIVPTLPSAWLSMGTNPVVEIQFVSGRTIEATLDHRWVKRRRNDRRESWEWVTTADLRIGDALPICVGVEAWGDEGDSFDGYFVGAMLGDGCMTNCGTPEFAQVDEPSRADMLQFMEDYAAKYGCTFKSAGPRKWRFIFEPIRKRNPLTDLLRGYEVWGLKSHGKCFPNRPLSKEFWIGAIAGLIDTDGCVRLRVNPSGTRHASVEYASVSAKMARQVSDALLRLGIHNMLRSTPLRPFPASALGQSVGDIYIVEINRAAAIKRTHELLPLRHAGKRQRLAEAAEMLPETPHENVEADRIVAISEPYDAEVYCVSIDGAESFVANGLVTGNCLRNLRNFEGQGIPESVKDAVIARLMDPAEVANSRQFPYRFYSAHKANANNVTWGRALERALDLSVANIPELPGRTLVLVDVSGSMSAALTAKTQVERWEVGALFGAALAKRSPGSDLVAFGTYSVKDPFPAGTSVLKTVERIHQMMQSGRIGWGTNVRQAIASNYDAHRRVVVFTDEQGHDTRHNDPLLKAIPFLHVFNLGGYRASMAPSEPGVYSYGGFTDATFRMMPLLERGLDQGWPWE